jgi:hypothetical protein
MKKEFKCLDLLGKRTQSKIYRETGGTRTRKPHPGIFGMARTGSGSQVLPPELLHIYANLQRRSTHLGLAC